MSPSRLLLLALLCLPAVLAAPDEIVLGMSAAFRGPTGALGTELWRGSMAWFEHVNQSGGVHGRTIRIQAYDDGYNPTPALRNTVSLIRQDKVFLLYQYVGTPTTTRVLPLLKIFQAERVFLFFPFTGAEPPRTEPYGDRVFNLRASYLEETRGLVENLVAQGYEKIGVFYQNDAYGRGGWQGVREALAGHGLTITADAAYRRGAPFESDFKAQVRILGAAGVDAVIGVGAYAATAAFVRDARDTGLDVPIANLSFVGSENLLALLLEAGAASGKNYTTKLINSQVVPSYEDTTMPAVLEYRELIDRHAPQPPFPRAGEWPPRYSFAGLEGFLNAKLMVEILKRSGSPPDRSKIRAAAESIREFDLGIRAPATFGPGRHQALDRVYYTTVEGGRFVPIDNWEKWRIAP